MKASKVSDVQKAFILKLGAYAVPVPERPQGGDQPSDLL